MVENKDQKQKQKYFFVLRKQLTTPEWVCVVVRMKVGSVGSVCVISIFDVAPN